MALANAPPSRLDSCKGGADVRSRPVVTSERSRKIGVTTNAAWGCADPAAVRYLLTAGDLEHAPPVAVDVGALAAYDRPQPSLHAYDQLLAGRPRAEGQP